VQPQRICVSSNEFIDRHPFNQLRPPHACPSTIYENVHKRGFAFILSAFLFLREFSFVQDGLPDVKWIERKDLGTSYYCKPHWPSNPDDTRSHRTPCGSHESGLVKIRISSFLSAANSLTPVTKSSIGLLPPPFLGLNGQKMKRRESRE
jgi:hypothetical protein